MPDHTNSLSPRIVEQIERLHGRIRDDFEPRQRVVMTPAGEHPVPPSVQAVLAVVWPAGQRLRTKNEFEWEVDLYSGEGAETEPGLVAEDRAWYTIGVDEGQWYLLVDLAEAATTTEVPTYRVDHEGHQPVPAGVPLAARLADLRRSTSAIEFGRACAWGDVERVRAALESGVGTGPLERTGLTPLHLATFSGSAETVRLLLATGADPNAAIIEEVSGLDTWSIYFEPYRGRRTEFDPLVDMALYERETPLHSALRKLGIDYVAGLRASLPDMVGMMLTGGADPTLHNDEDYSPADIAFSKTFSTPEADSLEIHECLQLLYDAGAELDAYAD
ncbi:ankyrin repeat domain-containing protein [Spirillospora sp. NPDC049652]